MTNTGFSFRWHERLHRDREFRRVLTKGRRVVHPALFLFFCPRDDGRAVRRLGLITSRAVGIAADRNRVKRLLREIFRLNKHRLAPGLDMVFMLRRGAVGQTFAQMNTAVTGLWRTAGILMQDENPLPPGQTRT